MIHYTDEIVWPRDPSEISSLGSSMTRVMLGTHLIWDSAVCSVNPPEVGGSWYGGSVVGYQQIDEGSYLMIADDNGVYGPTTFYDVYMDYDEASSMFDGRGNTNHMLGEDLVDTTPHPLDRIVQFAWHENFPYFMAVSLRRKLPVAVSTDHWRFQLPPLYEFPEFMPRTNNGREFTHTCIDVEFSQTGKYVAYTFEYNSNANFIIYSTEDWSIKYVHDFVEVKLNAKISPFKNKSLFFVDNDKYLYFFSGVNKAIYRVNLETMEEDDIPDMRDVVGLTGYAEFSSASFDDAGHRLALGGSSNSDDSNEGGEDGNPVFARRTHIIYTSSWEEDFYVSGQSGALWGWSLPPDSVAISPDGNYIAILYLSYLYIRATGHDYPILALIRNVGNRAGSLSWADDSDKLLCGRWVVHVGIAKYPLVDGSISGNTDDYEHAMTYLHSTTKGGKFVRLGDDYYVCSSDYYGNLSAVKYDDDLEELITSEVELSRRIYSISVSPDARYVSYKDSDVHYLDPNPVNVLDTVKKEVIYDFEGDYKYSSFSSDGSLFVHASETDEDTKVIVVSTESWEEVFSLTFEVSHRVDVCEFTLDSSQLLVIHEGGYDKYSTEHWSLEESLDPLPAFDRFTWLTSGRYARCRYRGVGNRNVFAIYDMQTGEMARFLSNTRPTVSQTKGGRYVAIGQGGSLNRIIITDRSLNTLDIIDMDSVTSVFFTPDDSHLMCFLGADYEGEYTVKVLRTGTWEEVEGVDTPGIQNPNGVVFRGDYAIIFSSSYATFGPREVPYHASSTVAYNMKTWDRVDDHVFLDRFTVYEPFISDDGSTIVFRGRASLSGDQSTIKILRDEEYPHAVKYAASHTANYCGTFQRDYFLPAVDQAKEAVSVTGLDKPIWTSTYAGGGKFYVVHPDGSYTPEDMKTFEAHVLPMRSFEMDLDSGKKVTFDGSYGVDEESGSVGYVKVSESHEGMKLGGGPALLSKGEGDSPDLYVHVLGVSDEVNVVITIGDYLYEGSYSGASDYPESVEVEFDDGSTESLAANPGLLSMGIVSIYSKPLEDGVEDYVASIRSISLDREVRLIPEPAEVGEEYAGGIYVGVFTSDKPYALVVQKPEDFEKIKLPLLSDGEFPEGFSDIDMSDALARWNSLVDDGINFYPAAQYCYDLTYGGHSDWKMLGYHEYAEFIEKLFDMGYFGEEPEDSRVCTVTTGSGASPSMFAVRLNGGFSFTSPLNDMIVLPVRLEPLT